MIFVERTHTTPASLAIEREKSHGDYNQPDVKTQLYKDFHDKCYICEIKPVQDGGVIEHLKSHKGNSELKFAWTNLFLACGHCNGIKNCAEYETGVIDCTVTDPSTLLSHDFDGHKVNVIALNAISESANKTAELINECFNGKSTVTREKAATIRIEALQNEMTKFYKVLDKYKSSRSLYYKKQINAMMRSDTAFTAFKKDYISNNPSILA